MVKEEFIITEGDGVNPFSIPFKPTRKEDYENFTIPEGNGINPFSIPFHPKRKEDYDRLLFKI